MRVGEEGERGRETEREREIIYILKKDYLVLLNQLDRNLASDVSTRYILLPMRCVHFPIYVSMYMCFYTLYFRSAS